MENTIENKAKFFAQYWCQKVFKTSINQETPHKNNFGSSIKKTDFLELKPLSQISDEDLEYIRPLVGYQDTHSGLSLVKRWLTPLWVEDYNYFALTDTKNVLVTMKIVDYLRSKSYALPWMGLSVEQLIEYGWIKLKED